MPSKSVKQIIDEYISTIETMAKDPTPGHKSIVIYGDFMDKPYNTMNILNGGPTLKDNTII